MTYSLLGFGYLEQFSKKIFLFIGSFPLGGSAVYGTTCKFLPAGTLLASVFLKLNYHVVKKKQIITFGACCASKCWQLLIITNLSLLFMIVILKVNEEYTSQCIKRQSRHTIFLTLKLCRSIS